MLEKSLSRRGFLAAGGACTMLAVWSTTQYGPWAFASSTSSSSDAAVASVSRDETVVPTMCAGCGNHCGLLAYVDDGTINRVAGMEDHPFTKGYLCGRGQGYPSIVHAANRVQKPMKSDGRGGFSEVSWSDALSDIASELEKAGPEHVGFFQDGRGTDDYFTKRLMAAFGSANYYTDSAFNDIDISAVIMDVLGTFPAPDSSSSKCIVFLDK